MICRRLGRIVDAVGGGLGGVAPPRAGRRAPLGAPAAAHEAEDLGCADEGETDEGALETVEDDEDVPEGRPVKESREEAKHPAEAHHKGELRVQEQPAHKSIRLPQI